MSYLEEQLHELIEERRVLVDSIIPHWKEKTVRDEVGVLNSSQINRVLANYQEELIILDNKIVEVSDALDKIKAWEKASELWWKFDISEAEDFYLEIRQMEAQFEFNIGRPLEEIINGN